MKVQYLHYRIPEIWFDAMLESGLRKGSPPLNSLSIYSRKQQGFLNPYESNYYPSSRGGATRCTIIDEAGNRYVGWSHCSLSDNFAYFVGRAIAYQRAYSDYLEFVPY